VQPRATVSGRRHVPIRDDAARAPARAIAGTPHCDDGHGKGIRVGKQTDQKHIVVINDAQEVLEIMRDLLEDEGYRVSLYSGAIRDLNHLEQLQPDLLVLDHLMGSEEYGWQMAQKIRLSRSLAPLPIIVCTAAAEMVRGLEGHLKTKNVNVILKPFDIDDLLGAVAEGLNGSGSNGRSD
jgi:CheY-like chemotaxis protein